MKVGIVLGTRPEIIKLSRVIAELDKRMHHVLVHTGQNFDYELNQIFFDDLEIRRPDAFLNCAGANAAETIGRIIIAVDAELAKYALGRSANCTPRSTRGACAQLARRAGSLPGNCSPTSADRPPSSSRRRARSPG